MKPFVSAMLLSLVAAGVGRGEAPFGEMTLMLPGEVPLEFVRIPAGTFQMGAPPCEPHREIDEVLHEVTLTRDYWIGKYEVTNRQFRLFKPDHSTAPGEMDEPDRPVGNISWQEAADFCAWASEVTGRRVRLLTEAEWERACRAGSQTVYHYGDDHHVLTDYAWIFPNTNSVNQPVGTKPPNAWGVYDITGNVAEWVNDWYEGYPPGPRVDPQGPDRDTGLKCFRECSASSRPYECRCAVRDWADPGPYGPQLGMRVACDVLPEDGAPRPTHTPNTTPSPTPTRLPTVSNNFLANPSFEYDLRADALPTSWREGDACCGAGIWDCDHADVPCREGAGVRIYGWTHSSRDPICSEVRQTLSTEGMAGELRFAAWVYTRGPNARVRLKADPRGGTDYSLLGEWVSTDEAWQQHQLLIPAGAYGPLLTVAADLAQEGSPEWIRVYIDDMSLYYAAPGASEQP